MSVPVVPEPPDHSTQSQSLFSYEFSGAVFDPAVDSKSQSQILPFLLSESLSLQSVPLLAEGDADKGSATKGIADKGKVSRRLPLISESLKNFVQVQPGYKF